jgi:hypothetical protein
MLMSETGHDRPRADDWLGRWAMNLMLINVSTRKSDGLSGFLRARRQGGAAGSF